MRFTVKAKLAQAFSRVTPLSAGTERLGTSNLASRNERLDNIMSAPGKPATRAGTNGQPTARAKADRTRPDRIALNVTAGGADRGDAEFERI